MLRHIRPEDLLESDEFVLEPVLEAHRRIDEDSSHNIILTGCRGCGKSVLLHHLEKANLERQKKTIYTWFDAVSTIPTLDDVYPMKFYEHYYELSFSSKLLNYIQDNYPDLFSSYFEEIEEEISEYSFLMHYYMQHAYFEEVELDHYLTFGEFSSKILELFRKVSKVDSISLAIDRFDSTNGVSPYSQEVISHYFPLFDKTILACDDQNISFDVLSSRGFSHQVMDYGEDFLVAREILLRRLHVYLQKHKVKHAFSPLLLTDEIFQDLIAKTHGNLSLMLQIMDDILSSYDFYHTDKKEYRRLLDRRIHNIISKDAERAKHLERTFKSPKLYL